MRNPFLARKSLSELQEEDELLDYKLSITKKKAMIKELEHREGKGSWKIFSNNGKKMGVNFQRVKNWLKSH